MGTRQAAKQGLSNVKLIITDWSGVISDDRHMVYESNMRLLEKYGGSRRTFEEWLGASQLTCAAFLESAGLRLDPAVVAEEYPALLTVLREEGLHPTVYPDAHEFVRGVGGRELVVVSSHPKSHLLAEANEYGLTDHIVHFVGNATDKGKEIARILGARPSLQALYMGDTVYDIQAAKRAGVVSVGVASGYHTRDRLIGEDPDHVFNSLTELLAEL